MFRSFSILLFSIYDLFIFLLSYIICLFLLTNAKCANEDFSGADRLLGGSDDEPVPVNGNHGQRVRRHEDGCALKGYRL